MKICRFQHDGLDVFGRIEGKDVEVLRARSIDEVSTDSPGEARVPLSDVTFRVPCEPTKIVAVGRNYADHAKELGNEVPTEPLIFLKPPSALLPCNSNIEMPAASERVDYEGELAVVIGRRARRIEADDWRRYVLGFTCANDVTARDLQKKDVQFTRGKGFDTFCPLGPWIETALDPSDLELTTRVNRETRQHGRTSSMIFPIPRLVEWISHVMTLEPGDVILTGTPEGVGPLRQGDLVEVEISGLGTLVNRVVQAG